MCMNFYYFLSYLSAIDLNRLTCVNKSYNIMISSNDRLYQDLYEKYFNKIKINSNVKEEKEVVVEVEQEVKEESISYKTLFERIYKMSCYSCNRKLASKLYNQTILPYECSDCNKVNCGDCKCICRYCNICNAEFEDEKNNERTIKISNVYVNYEIPFVIKCDLCLIHVHTTCHLKEAKCFRYRQCPGCMIRACQDCSINISNHCKKCSNNFITRIIGDRRYFLSNGNFCNNCYVQNESCCKLHLDQDE